MFDKLFGRNSPKTGGDQGASGLRSTQSLGGSENAMLAAEMLMSPPALMQLNLKEAQVVVQYMRPQFIPEGTTFIREGDTEDNDFMVLVLDGEVTVENIVVSRVSPITVTVLGPGSMHGELGLIDGLPRSASCTASSELRCAILTRDAMRQLLADFHAHR